MKSSSKLPDKPSELLMLAMLDLEKVESMPEKYSINMGMWHSPTLGLECEVCLAGCVMAQTLKTPITEYKAPVDFSIQDGEYVTVQAKLHALDSLRRGSIKAGLDALAFAWSFYGQKLPMFYHIENSSSNFPSFLVEPLESYDEDPKAWKEHMATLIGIFQAEGI